MAGGGDVEGCGEVTAQCSQRLTVNCGSFTKKRVEAREDNLQENCYIKLYLSEKMKLIKVGWRLRGTQSNVALEISFGKYPENGKSRQNVYNKSEWAQLVEYPVFLDQWFSSFR